MNRTAPASRKPGDVFDSKRPPRQIRAVAADDHPLVRQGLVRALEDDGRFDVVAQAGNGWDAASLIHDLRPDLAVLDLRMPGVDGLQLATRVTAGQPDTHVVILTAFNEPELLNEVLKTGAAGFLSKGADREEICDALARAALGERVFPATVTDSIGAARLTPFECEVLQLLADGRSDDSVGLILDLDPADVHWHVHRAVRKLAVEDRSAAILAARASRYIS